MASQRPSTWLALRCKEAQFQRFLGVASEEQAAEVVRIICGVDSRAEVDTNTDAQRLWHDVIRKPYLQFQQDPQNQPKDQEK